MIKRFNQYDDHHGWLLSLVTDNEFHHRVMKDIIGDRRKVDKIINFYHPLFEAGKIPIPIEITHLKTLRSDLLDYANLFTKVKNWNPE